MEQSPAPGHTKTWIALGILAVVLVLGTIVKAKTTRRQVPEEGAEP